MQLDWHDLKTNGSPALLRTLKQIQTALTQQEQEISELQYLLSEEIMASLASPSERREVIADLGHGWRIERQPQSTPVATTIGEVDQQMAAVGSALRARERTFIHSPGYPADDGENSGAEQMTDIGLTYRDLSDQLAGGE